MSERIPDDSNALYNEMHQQTGRIAWPELQRHYARGVLVIVVPDLDLIEVATVMAQNNTHLVEAWLSAGQLRRAQDNDARRWQEHSTEFWSCVVAPWVLVQELIHPQ